MKKMLSILCTAVMLCASGCGNSAAQSSETEVTAPVQDTVASETTADEEKMSVSETTSAAESETDAATVVTSETPDSTMQTSDETVITPVIPGDDEPDADICGRWAYGNGYEMEFHEDLSLTVSMDYSEVVFIEDGTLQMENIRLPLTVAEGRVTAVQGEETVLSMVALEGADPAALTGRYQLESCSLLDAVAGPEAQTVYYVHLTGTRFLVETMAEYQILNESSTLYMINDTEVVPLHYILDGDILRIADSEGNVDELTRIE